MNGRIIEQTRRCVEIYISSFDSEPLKFTEPLSDTSPPTSCLRTTQNLCVCVTLIKKTKNFTYIGFLNLLYLSIFLFRERRDGGFYLGLI